MSMGAMAGPTPPAAMPRLLDHTLIRCRRPASAGRRYGRAIVASALAAWGHDPALAHVLSASATLDRPTVDGLPHAAAFAAPLGGAGIWLLPVLLSLLAILLGLWASTRRLGSALREESRRRQEAEQALQARDRFIGFLGHELRGTVAALGAGLGVLRDGDQPADLQQELLRTMQQAARQLQQLLESTLDHAGAAHGRLHLQLRPTPLSTWWSQALAPLRLDAGLRGLVLREHTRWPADLRLTMDGTRVAQVLANLGHNALKFTPAGEVRVEARWDGHALTLHVADQGPGITPDEQARIFDPYQQGSAAVGQRQGAGLGLAITRQLVQAMGGRLDLVSSPGAGSEFIVRLPLQAATGPVRPPCPDRPGAETAVA
ncbi:MAG: hypothetical protein RLY78_4125 [Pseudomonadota bacterium]